MLAHNLKGILALIPEAMGLVKKANLEEDFPLDSADSASASYLRAHYLEKVAGKRIDADQMALVTKAANLYGVKEELDAYLHRFNMTEKKASQQNKPIPVKVAEANFEGNLSGFGFLSIEKTAEEASSLYNTYGSEITSADILKYSGHAYMNKEAAVQSLGNRFYASKNSEFVKMARDLVTNVQDNDFEAIKSFCDKVTFLDKKAGLDIIGFNFYKEALLAKKAEYEKVATVTLAGAEIPYNKVMAFGKDGIASTLGKDIADDMTDCPVHNKAVLESLPRDLQLMLKSILKSV
jgi:hypothetical protein